MHSLIGIYNRVRPQPVAVLQLGVAPLPSGPSKGPSQASVCCLLAVLTRVISTIRVGELIRVSGTIIESVPTMMISTTRERVLWL